MQNPTLEQLYTDIEFARSPYHHSRKRINKVMPGGSRLRNQCRLLDTP